MDQGTITLVAFGSFTLITTAVGLLLRELFAPERFRRGPDFRAAE